MLDTPTHRQEQLWIVQRLYRICSVLHKQSRLEPCLEQYESRVGTVMDEEVTPAAAAWIQMIVQSLRDGTSFRPEDYID